MRGLGMGAEGPKIRRAERLARNLLFVGKPTALFPVPRYQALSGAESRGLLGKP
jgi:hypothetical protein